MKISRHWEQQLKVMEVGWQFQTARLRKLPSPPINQALSGQSFVAEALRLEESNQTTGVVCSSVEYDCVARSHRGGCSDGCYFQDCCYVHKAELHYIHDDFCHHTLSLGGCDPVFTFELPQFCKGLVKARNLNVSNVMTALLAVRDVQAWNIIGPPQSACIAWVDFFVDIWTGLAQPSIK